MDTQLLSAFITVAQKLSFSQAAEHLSLTQSAISKRIALLEEQLSVILFDRIGRRVVLTEAGQALLPRALHILSVIDDTQRFMEQQKDDVNGTLRIATSHHIGIHRLPSLLKHYKQQYPEVHLQLQFIDSEQATRAIQQGEYDLALITLPDMKDTDDGDIQHHLLWCDPMQFVVNKQHPLSTKKRLTLKDLTHYPAILPDISTRTTQLVQTLFSAHDIPFTISMSTNHLDAIKMMVNVGLGWSTLPQRLIDDNLHALPISKITLERNLGCIHHRHRILSNAARAMLDLLRQQQ